VREKIIEATFLKFSEKGYSASLSEIAKIVGLRKQSIYNYFPSKDDLFYEMINVQIKNYCENKMNLDEIEGLTTENKLKEVFFSVINYFTNPNTAKFWQWLTLVDSEKLLLKISREILKQYSELLILIEEIFIEGIDNEEFYTEDYKSIFRMYIVILQGTMDSTILNNHFINNDFINDSGEFIENVWESFWNSVKKKN